MFLRRHNRKKNGETYEYWTLVESVRTGRGPRQRIVATLGKVPGLDKEEQVGWEEITRTLNRKPKEKDLFQKEPDVPNWATVNINRVYIERLRRFGDVYLGLLLWKKLKFDEVFNKFQLPGYEEVDWPLIFCLLTIARFCSPSSELAIAEGWYEKTALEDLLGVPVEMVNDDRLYRALDHMLPHKESVCGHLQDRYKDLFGAKFDFLLYDVTSTYFEGQCKKNPKAKRGYSRDRRPDCLQICIGLVVTEEGLPVGYEVFDGNKRDVTTLEDIVELMEEKYGKANRIWVLDRGIVSEENIDYLIERRARYIVGTPRGLLKEFESNITDKSWQEIEPDIEAKILKHPDYGKEKFLLCRSSQRAQKERAMLKRQINRLQNELQKIKISLNKGKLKNISKIERRIGRWMGRYSKAEKLFDIELIKKGGYPIDLKIEKKKDHFQWALKIHGCYVLRTNLTEEDPKKLWKMYMQLNQAENAFRMSKSDLGMRPIFHQKEHRVEAHIFICFLALSMYKSLELWMVQKELGSSPAKLLKEFKEIRSMDVVLPVKDRNPIRLRVVGRPDEHVKILLYRLGIKIPNRPKILQNVVQNLPS